MRKSGTQFLEQGVVATFDASQAISEGRIVSGFGFLHGSQLLAESYAFPPPCSAASCYVSFRGFRRLPGRKRVRAEILKINSETPEASLIRYAADQSRAGEVL